MSMTYATSFTAEELEEFLLDQHQLDTGIPVHPFNAVFSMMKTFDRSLGITDGNGTLFVTECEMTAYGHSNNHRSMIRALQTCGAAIDFIW